MCEEYEYEPHGVGSTGHATPNMAVRTRVQKQRPMGLLAAHKRANPRPAAKITAGRKAHGG